MHIALCGIFSLLLGLCGGFVFGIWVAGHAPPTKAADPVNIHCRVKGGPDHGHAFMQAFPADSAGFVGVLRNLAKYNLINSELRIEFDPEPSIVITRLKPDFLDPKISRRPDTPRVPYA